MNETPSTALRLLDYIKYSRPNIQCCAEVLTTYQIQLGERPSPHNAKYPQCMKNCIGL